MLDKHTNNPLAGLYSPVDSRIYLHRDSVHTLKFEQLGSHTSWTVVRET